MRIVILDRPPAPELDAIERAFDSVCGPGTTELVTSVADLMRRLEDGSPCDLVVMDYFVGDGEATGLQILPRIRAVDPHLPVVVVAEHVDVQSEGAAIRAGALDFLIRSDQLEQRVSNAIHRVKKVLNLVDERRSLARRAARLEDAERRRYRMVGRSPQLRRVMDQIERVASVPRPVLITGERGTGKELVARALHEAAGGPGRPFVAVNCAAVSESLLESELFGHERGAFTGAATRTSGKFEQASGGTLFLDEIGNMSLGFQRKILRVTEYQTFTRVGGKEEVEAKTRLLAATNANLQDKMQRGEFLPDLYDRLAFEVIAVPALRDREGDVKVLAQHFLEQFMQEVPSFAGKRLADEALELLQRYPFPGNVRELKSIVERAVYRDTTNDLEAEDIGMLDDLAAPQSGTFKERLAALEHQLLVEALQSAEDNQAEAARILGLSYAQLRHYIKKHGLST